MFTGLIADMGEVRALHEDRDGATLRIATRLAGELA
jgi:riboflavin synthase alpha subunit